MKKIKILVLSFVFVFITGLALYHLPWVHKINTTIQGVQCRISDNDYLENVSITVKGIYMQYLFQDDVFEGTIKIDKYDYTVKDTLFPMHFNENGSFLLYGNNKAEQNILGKIYCTPDFKQLLIFVFELADQNTAWDPNHGLFISAPSGDRVNAIDIAKRLTQDDLAVWFK